MRHRNRADLKPDSSGRVWLHVDPGQCESGSTLTTYRSSPGGAMEGSTINERFTTSEAAHSSVHFCHGDTSFCCDSSSQTGRLDVRRTLGWDSMSDIRGRVTVEDVILLRSWDVAANRRIWEGVMWMRIIPTTEEMLGAEFQRLCAWIHSAGHQSVYMWCEVMLPRLGHEMSSVKTAKGACPTAAGTP